MDDPKELMAMPETAKLGQVSTFFESERLNQMHKLATYFHQAGCFGGDVKNAAQALVKIQAGLEMGIPPMEAMNSLYIVNGKLTMYGPAMSKRLRLKGWSIKYDDAKNDECTVTITKGLEVFSYTATMADLIALKSKAIAFAAKDKLKWHAISRLIRFYVPEVLEAGIAYFDEEIEDRGGIRVMDILGRNVEIDPSDVEMILSMIEQAETLEHLQEIAGKIDKLSPDDIRTVQQAIIKKRAEFKKVTVGGASGGEVIGVVMGGGGGGVPVPKRAPVVIEATDSEIIEPSKTKSQERMEKIEQKKEVDATPAEEVKQTPAKTQPIDYWTEEKIARTLTSLKTNAEVLGFKDDFVRLFTDGEITETIYNAAIKGCQIRLNQITKERRDEAEQTSIQ